MQKVLQYLATDEGDSDLIEEGRHAYYGGTRTSLYVINRLLRSCLISISGQPQYDKKGAITYYRINEEGRAALIDPDYIPFIHR